MNLIDNEQSLLPHRDSPGTDKQASKREIACCVGDFALARLFVFLDYLISEWKERLLLVYEPDDCFEKISSPILRIRTICKSLFFFFFATFC